MAKDIQALNDLAQATRQTYAETERLTKSLNLEAKAALEAFNLLEQLAKSGYSNAESFDELNQTLGITQKQFEQLNKVQEEANSKQQQFVDTHKKAGEDQKKDDNFLTLLFKGAQQVSSAYHGIELAFSLVQRAGAEAYESLIQQNIVLQEQLLSTQASLASMNRVFADGLEIKDPAEKIKGLTAPVGEAIAELRKGSFDLVGVTSSELIPTFQQVAQNANQIGASLSDSAKLALGFGAAAQTLRLPLFQASNEAQGILQGTINTYNVLARSLNINNAMVSRWKGQGIAVEELNKRLETFRAGNALGAETVGGLTANIREYLQEFGRVAGAPLLEPFVKLLQAEFAFIKDHKDEIQTVINNTVNYFFGIAQKVAEAIEGLMPTITTLAKAAMELFDAFSSGASAAGDILVQTFVNLVKISTPFLESLAHIVDLLAQIVDTPIGKFAIEFGLLFGIATTLVAPVGFLIGAVTALPGLFTLAAGSISAMTGGTAGVIALGGAVTALGVTLAVLTGAFIGAAAAAAIYFKKEQIKDVNEAQEAFAQQLEDMGGAALTTAQKLKALNDQEDKNGKLTEEQAKQKRFFVGAAKAEIQGYEDKIKALKELNAQTPEQENTNKAQIADAERMIELLKKESGGIKLLANDLPDLGNEYEQLALKAEQAQKQIENKGGGVDAIYQDALKTAIATAQKQTELGFINKSTAIATIQRIRDDNKNLVEVQEQAEQAIQKIRLEFGEEIQKQSDDNVKRTELRLNQEVISDAESQRLIAKERDRYFNIEIKRNNELVNWSLKHKEEITQQAITNTEKEIAETEKRRDLAEKNRELKGTRLANEEIKRLTEKRKIEEQTLEYEGKLIIDAKNKREKDLEEKAASDKKELDRVRKLRIQASEDNIKILTDENEARQITEQEFYRKDLALEESLYKEKTRQIAERRKKLSPSDIEGQRALDLEQAEANKRLYDSQKKGEEARLKAIQAGAEAQLKILQLRNSEGLVNEQEYSKATLDLTQKRLDAELAMIKYQESKLPKGDERLAELQGQEADIAKKRIDAQEKYQDDQLKIIDRAQQRATDIVLESEANRNVEIAKLETSLTIRKADGDVLRGEVHRKVIERELEAEQAKYKALNEMDYVDKSPENIAKVEQQLSQMRVSIANKTKELVEDEMQQRQRLYQQLVDHLNTEQQKRENIATGISQGLEKERTIIESQNKSLDYQKSLLEAKKNLISSVAGYYETELGILKETNGLGTEQKQLAETTAGIRLKAAMRQAEVEKQILELNIQQRDAALEQEKIGLQVQKAQGDAAVVGAAADEQKVNSDPLATQGQKDAAALKTKAALLSRSALDLKDDELAAKDYLNKKQAEAERGNLDRTSEENIDKARLDYIKNEVNSQDRANDLYSLRQETLKKFGIPAYLDKRDSDRIVENINLGSQEETPNLGNKEDIGKKLEVIQQQLYTRLLLGTFGTQSSGTNTNPTNAGLGVFSPIQQPKTPILDTPNIQINKKETSQNISAKKQALSNGIMININNSFLEKNPENEKLAEKSAQMNGEIIRKEIRDILILVEQS